MSNFNRNYKKILETLQSIEKRMNLRNQIRKPKPSDMGLIAIDLTSEFMGIDSERDLFRKLPVDLASRIERSVYNRRKRRLFVYREQLRKKLAGHVGTRGCYIVDSIPLEVCRESRS